jgi:hypothetical protein
LRRIRHTLRAHWNWRLGIVAALAALAIAGGIVSLTAFNSSPEPVATGAGQTTTTDGSNGSSDPEQAGLEFAQCMRENGVPTFPDPVANADGTFRIQRPQGVAQSTLISALESCQAELEASGIQLGAGNATQDPEVQDKLLEFSQCMRDNGVPEFPDPQPNSGIRGLFGDVDPQSPRVQDAMQSCQSVLSQLGGPFGGGGG